MLTMAMWYLRQDVCTLSRKQPREEVNEVCMVARLENRLAESLPRPLTTAGERKIIDGQLCRFLGVLGGRFWPSSFEDASGTGLLVYRFSPVSYGSTALDCLCGPIVAISLWPSLAVDAGTVGRGAFLNDLLAASPESSRGITLPPLSGGAKLRATSSKLHTGFGFPEVGAAAYHTVASLVSDCRYNCSRSCQRPLSVSWIAW